MDTFGIIKSNRLAFWFACLAALAILFVSERSYHKAARSLDELRTMGQARMNIHRLERGLLNAETAQRGYLLTHRQEYLEPYQKARQSIAEALQYLDQRYKGDAQAKTLLEKLHTLTESRLSELALTLRLYDEGKAKTAVEMVLSGIGREQMMDTLALTDDLLRQESLRFEEGRTNIDTTLLLSRIGLAAFCALVILALLVYSRKNATLMQQQLKIKNQVQFERDQLEMEVSRRTESLAQLTHHLQTSREDERRRLASDLHDELGALLTSAKLDVARIKPRLTDAAPAALGLLTHLVDTLNNCVALKRRIVEGLQPSSLSHLGLVATLDILARELSAQTGIEVHRDLNPVKLEAATELVIYRVVQESFTNLTKYAQAHNVWLTLGTRGGFAQVSVRDDGVGFDTARQPNSAHGLAGMRFRVEAEGGSFGVESAPGKGTLIRASLPESANHTPQD
ncbi:CHASE3 domain-containing protein [Rhodoferax ferrireducens]|uniref:CHASE3 domain-containing protein n=1 Tax=Rhodoferax ferrireducens TaxID=192843 RepID=UPI000E0D0523|nr:CHASE3 domain-containing protein [Rhodoferax ferrireducens]